jgi:hypothetical protein
LTRKVSSLAREENDSYVTVAYILPGSAFKW